MPTKEEATMEQIRIALGEVSALFMSKECKGTEIVMPSEELLRISNNLGKVINEIYNGL